MRPATEILLTGAVIDRWYPDRRSAGAHAMELVREIGSGRLVPSQAGPDDAPGRPPAG